MIHTAINGLDFDKLLELKNEKNIQIFNGVLKSLKCFLCKHLLINAHVTPCDCKFCCYCIESFLSKGNFICPGKKIECSNELLELDKNVWVDHITNRKISKLKIKCPNEMCRFEDHIVAVIEHIANCDKLSVECPYLIYGCNNMKLTDNDIANHLVSNKDSHIQLMSLKIMSLLEENEDLKNQVKSLNKKIDKNKIWINETEKQIKDLKNSFTSKLNEIIANQKSLSTGLEVDLDKKQALLIAMKIDLFSILNSNLTEFRWSIVNRPKVPFQKKVSLSSYKSISHSNDFFTHPGGSKMRIDLKNDGNSYFIFPKIIEVDKNRNIVWPIKCKVTLGIVNGTTNQLHDSDTKIIDYSSFYGEIPSFNYKISDLATYTSLNSLTIMCLVKVIS